MTEQKTSEFLSDSAAETARIAPLILDFCKNQKIFAIFGEMGAGKTTLVRAMCACLGVKENVSSPTFSLVNEYLGTEGPVFHFDFYRIKNVQEAWDMGYEEYFSSGHYCFIEWPQLIEGLLPEKVSEIRISETDAGERLIQVFCNSL